MDDPEEEGPEDVDPNPPNLEELGGIIMGAIRKEYNKGRTRDGGADHTCHLCGDPDHFIRDCKLLAVAKMHLEEKGFLGKKGGADKLTPPPSKKGQA